MNVNYSKPFSERQKSGDYRLMRNYTITFRDGSCRKCGQCDTDGCTADNCAAQVDQCDHWKKRGATAVWKGTWCGWCANESIHGCNTKDTCEAHGAGYNDEDQKPKWFAEDNECRKCKEEWGYDPRGCSTKAQCE